MPGPNFPKGNSKSKTVYSLLKDKISGVIDDFVILRSPKNVIGGRMAAASLRFIRAPLKCKYETVTWIDRV